MKRCDCGGILSVQKELVEKKGDLETWSYSGDYQCIVCDEIWPREKVYGSSPIHSTEGM